MPVSQLYERFWPYVRAIRWLAASHVLLVLIVPLISAALLWCFKELIDDVAGSGGGSRWPWIALIYTAAVSAKIAAEYAAQWCEANAVERIVLDIRRDLYTHILSLSPGSIGKTTPGDVLSRLEGDTIRAETFVYFAPMIFIADGAGVLVYTCLLFYLSWQLALVALAALPIIVAIIGRFSPVVRKASRIARRGEAHWMSLAEERLSTTPVVHAFDALDCERRAFVHRADKVRRMEVVSLLLQARQSATVETVVAVAGLGVLGLGAMLIGSGAMTVGALVAFIGTIGSLYTPVRSLAKASGRIQNGAAGAQRIADLLDIKSLVEEPPHGLPLKTTRARLCFQGVRYAYPEGPEVLHGIDLTLEPGETLAIVGPSGGGKSSLMRLALRLADPTQGRVLIDGQDIRDVTLASLRRTIVPVFQDPFILSGTLASNIRYGRPDLSEAEMQAAARDASVEAFSVEAQGGLALSTGHRGARLSGGQRQRLALARALAVDAPILVLDEATAAVDSETEELIQDALERLAGKRTLLIVAHRLSSIRRADRVVVLDKGRIVEMGRPDMLLAGPTRCRALFATQIAPIEAAA